MSMYIICVIARSVYMFYRNSCTYRDLFVLLLSEIDKHFATDTTSGYTHTLHATTTRVHIDSSETVKSAKIIVSSIFYCLTLHAPLNPRRVYIKHTHQHFIPSIIILRQEK